MQLERGHKTTLFYEQKNSRPTTEPSINMSVGLGLSQETEINEHMSLGLDLSQEMESPKGKSS